ncbi:MAG TPA: hypothetical protein VFZ66_14685 [Herpetosiphonaceae bacterium]
MGTARRDRTLIPAQAWLARTCLVIAAIGIVVLGRLPLLIGQAGYAWTYGLLRHGLPLVEAQAGLARYQQIVGPLESFVFSYPWLWPLLGALGLLLRSTDPDTAPAMRSKSISAIWLALLLAALGAGLWIRLAPLWSAQAALVWTLDYDEGVYVSAARVWLQGNLPYRDVWLSHPPTGIALLLPAVAIGDTGPAMLIAARRMTALIDVVTALLMLWVGRELGGWRIGAFAAGLYLLDGAAGRNSTHVWLETGLNCWSVAALGCALYGARRGATGWLLAAGACAMLAATTKYVGVVILVAILISFGAHRRWRMAATILGGSLLVLALCLLVSLPLGWDNLIRQTVLAQILRAPHDVSAIDRTALAVTAPASVLTVLVAVLGAIVVFRRRALPSLGWALVLTWLALVLLILMNSPVFYLHYVSQLMAPLALCGGGIAALSISTPWRKGLALAVAILVLLPLVVLQLRSLPADGPSWDIPASAERIRARTAAEQPMMSFEPLYNLFSDRDFMRAPDGRLLIDSYMHVPGMSVSWSSSIWRDLWQVLVRKAPLAPAADGDAVMTMLRQAPQAVFAPSRAPTTVEQAVILASEYRQYPLPSAMLYERLPHPRGVTVESLKIRGIVAPMEAKAGEPLEVKVLWQMTRPEPRTPFMSLQLVDAATHKWGQFDKPVGPEGAPFWAWKPGPKIYEDIVALPIDRATPPGTYSLLLAVYDPATGQPWQLTDEAGQPIALPYVVEQVTVLPR